MKNLQVLWVFFFLKYELCHVKLIQYLFMLKFCSQQIGQITNWITGNGDTLTSFQETENSRASVLLKILVLNLIIKKIIKPTVWKRMRIRYFGHISCGRFPAIKSSSLISTSNVYLFVYVHLYAYLLLYVWIHVCRRVIFPSGGWYPLNNAHIYLKSLIWNNVT